MTFEDDRTRQVRTGQAINLSVQLAINEHLGDPNATPAILERAAHLIGSVVQLIDQAQDAALTDARKTSVVEAFPGATIEPAAQAQIPQAAPVFVRREEGGPVEQFHLNNPGTYQQAAPAPIPGAVDGDPATAALWQSYFADPSAWWDNRRDKRNPKAPDFKHKASGDALWVGGKKNPSWVAGRLA